MSSKSGGGLGDRVVIEVIKGEPNDESQGSDKSGEHPVEQSGGSQPSNDAKQGAD